MMLEEREEITNEDQEETLFPEDFDQLLDDADEAVEYQFGLAFDHDFIRDGQYRIQTSSGIEAWKQWCINCLSYDRNNPSPLYSSDFGIDMNGVFQSSTRDEAENILSTEIKEALEADPYKRTEHVGNIEFTWDTDSISAAVEVVGIDEASIDIEVTIGR